MSSTSDPHNPPSALLFDLGGVVINLDFERMFRHWATLSRLDIDQVRRRFAVDRAYESHETGQLDSAAYFDHLRDVLELRGDDSEIAAGWNALLAGEIGETLDLIGQCRRRLPCYAFSNTNPTHQRSWSHSLPNMVAAFDRIFVSSEIGLRKPNPAAYQAVARAMGVSPSAIWFFDDLAGNVDGAERAGMRGILVRSPRDVELALRELRLPG